jgi:hypothetical protein
LNFSSFFAPWRALREVMVIKTDRMLGRDALPNPTLKVDNIPEKPKMLIPHRKKHHVQTTPHRANYHRNGFE